ncbi:MAG TPA: ABC transporter permease [Fibrobacteres bacterium]|jgi:ABC-type dipeptide/oligopeptide/nickel transport system permease subunit|nr:ABC transporter permease [Fibrobacterota bacterium]
MESMNGKKYMPAGRSLWGDAARRLLRDKTSIACFVVILIYVIVAVLSPLVFPDWSTAHDYDHRNEAPSLKYPLGTDALGRSVVQKVFLGAHVSITVGFMANVIAIPLGMLLGAIAGFFGRRIDDIIVWIYTTLASVPGIILLIALKFAFADRKIFPGSFAEIDLSGMAGVYIALGLTSWIGTCRLIRAETMKCKELDYVLAARACGRGNIAIMFKHILPNVIHIGIINFSLGFVGAISAEVILSFLNLGVQDLPSWGKMINEARMDLIVGRWWELSSAVVATFVIILAWNIFGDRLRDALDPKLK